MTVSVGQRRLDSILSPEVGGPVVGPASGLKIGVLALQGDFREHRLMLERLGAGTVEVRTPSDLERLDGLVIPGGESTTMSKLLAAQGLIEPLRRYHAGGGAVFGTCAGLIVCARDTVEGTPPTLGLIDITARRNAFGRQVRSFETDLDVEAMSGRPVPAVFIRAPWVERLGPGVEALASYQGHVVAARQGRVLVCAFHPELTSDVRWHGLFVRLARECSAGDSATGDGIVAPGEQQIGEVVPHVRAL